MENAVERVVVLDRDRINFVIVAARALHGETHGAARDHVDPVVNDIVRHPEEAPADGEESHGGEVRGIRGHELVRGDLQLQKAIVSQVLIERPDDPLAIGVGVGKLPLFAGVNVSLGIGIPRDIQPVASPSLAVTRTREQAFDQRSHGGIGIGGGGFFKGGDFIRRRRKARDIEAHPADQGARVGGVRRPEPSGVQFRENETIDVRLCPDRFLDGGRSSFRWKAKRPVLGIGRGTHGSREPCKGQRADDQERH